MKREDKILNFEGTLDAILIHLRIIYVSMISKNVNIQQIHNKCIFVLI